MLSPLRMSALFPVPFLVAVLDARLVTIDPYDGISDPLPPLLHHLVDHVVTPIDVCLPSLRLRVGLRRRIHIDTDSEDKEEYVLLFWLIL